MKKIYVLVLVFLNYLTVFSSTISLPPSATISGGTTLCQNATGSVITFTGSGGTAPYTFTYTITGIAGNQTISTTGSNNSVTTPIISSTAGIFTYNLLSVQDSSGAAIAQFGSATVVVNAPPIVDFTFTNDNSCSGTNIQFTTTVNPAGSYTYLWDFGDGTATTTAQNPSHSYVSLGCGTANFNATLTVTGNGCTVVKTKSVSVKQKPAISFIDNNNAFTPFSNCTGASSTNQTFNISVGNSSTASCVTSYSIDWGDGSVISNNVTFPALHTYTILGVYNMVISGLGVNGCSNSITFQIKNISNPAGGVLNPGGTVDMCLPTPIISYTIGNWGQNSPGTTYTVDYGDGTLITLNQNDMILTSYYSPSNPSSSANYPIPHSYTTNSCPATKFIIKLTVTNACKSTDAQVDGGNTISKTIANFTAPQISCINTNVLFNNNSILGFNGSCDKATVFVWDFGDPASSSNIINTGVVSNAPNANHTFSGPGTFTVTLTATNTCGTTTKTQQICIEPPLTPTFTVSANNGCTPFAITTNNTTSLVNQCSATSYAWSVAYSASNCGTSSAFTYTNGTSSTSINPSFNFTESGTYTIKLTATNSCGSFNTTQTVIVKKPPTVSIAAINNYCGTATINPFGTVPACVQPASSLTYAWSFPGGNPSSSTSANPGSIVYSTTGTYSVSLVVTNECGASNTATQTFNVSQSPVITNSSLSQTICSGTATTLVNLTANPTSATFSWTATAVGVSGFTTSGTNTIPVQTLSTTGTSVGTVTYVITPTIGTCVGATVNYVVTVIPAPTITTQPASSSVCLGGTPTLLSVVLNSPSITPAYQWYSNTNNSTSGGTLISGATNSTYSPPATTTGTFYYYCVITLSSGGCSSLNSSVATVTVNPLPTITSQPLQTQTICQGGIISALTVAYSGGLGTATYQWYSNSTNTTAGGSPVGTNSNSYTPSAFNTAGTYYFYVTISLSGNGCGAVTSNPAEIIVVNDPIITTQPLTTQTLCQNASPTALTVVATGGTSSYAYQWYSNSSPSNSGGTLIASAINATYQPITTTVGTKYYYCVITQTGLGCMVTSAVAAVIINTSPTIANQPSSSTVCQNGTATTLTFTYANGVGTPTYQWFSNANNSNTGGILLTGETNATFTPPSTTVGITYYYCTITFPSLTGSCGVITTNTASVTINSGAIINQQPTSTQSICIGGTIQNPLSITYTNGTGTPTYQWYSNATNSTTGGTAVGTNSSNYTPPVFNTAGTFYYYVVISFSGNGCGSITSTISQIDVIADPIVTTQPLIIQTLCQNAIPTSLTVVSSGGIGTFSYQWYSTPSSVTTGGSTVGTNSPSFIPPTNVVGTYYYYCTLTQVGLNCSTKSNSASVVINASPTVVNQPISSTVCQNGIPTTLTFTYANGVGTPTYQWFSNTINSNIGGTSIPSETNPAYIPPSNNIGIFYYYCVITFPNLIGNCSSVATSVAIVTINSSSAIDVQPTPSQSICVDGTIQNPLSVTYTNGTGTPTYQWYSNATNSTTGGTPVGINSPTYIPPIFNTLGSFYYYVVISFSGNGCGSITSTISQIDVIADPIVTAQPLPTQTLCQNETPTNLTVTITGGIGTISYKWFSTSTATNTGGTSVGTNSSSFTPPTNSVGTFYYYCSITQSGVACSVNSNSATVIINISPTIVNQPVSSIVCQNGTPTTLTFTYANGVGTPTYQWYSNSSNSNTGGSPLPSETNPTYVPISNNIGVFYYYCVITFPNLIGSCSSVATNAAIVTINQQSTVDIQPLPTQSICVGGTISNPLSVTYTNGTGTPTYQWYSNATNSTTGGTAVGTNSPNYTPPVFNTAGTFYYYVVISFSGNGCGSITSAAAEIVVVGDPTVSTQPLPTQTLCQNASATTLTLTASGGIGTFAYQWYSNTSNSTSGGTLISGATTDTFTPPTTNVGTLYYYCVITQPSGIGCNVSSQTSTVNVNIAPTISGNPTSSTVCLGQIPTQLTVSYINGTGTPSFQWYSNTSNSNIGGIAITTEVNPTFNPLSTIAGTFYYYCTITFPSLSGGCEIISSNTATVIINQIPIISNQNPTICSSATYTLTPTNSSTDNVPIGTTYTWSVTTINPIGSITGASSQAVSQTAISQTLTNTTTAPATITYTVTPKAGNCSGANFTITITINPATTPNVIVTNSTCFGVNNGSITTNISGGIPFTTGAPYLIVWTGPNSFSSTATSISNLLPGVYNLSITDAGGCPISNNYTITEPADIILTTNSNNNITCFGSNNGSIAISVIGGTGTYIYTWTKNGANYAATEDISNLSPATYIVTVTDANNCGPKTATFIITEPPILSVNLVSKFNIACYGFATGSITINTIGGTPLQTSPGIFTYNYLWTGPNGFTSINQNLMALFAGTYNLVVTDSLGCTKNLSVTITQSSEILITAVTTPIVCYNDNNATITTSVSGGNAPYQIQWSNLAVGLNQNNLSPGNYTITITDNIGCQKSLIINIPSPPIFDVSPVVTNISCFGAHDGSIVLNFVGGIAPVNLVWSDGNPAGITRNNLGPGTYSVIITDSKPCTISRIFTILEPQPLVLSANTTNALDCNTANSGAINLLVSGGTPPFNYLWNNGATTEDLSNISAGNYLITVTDARGCVKSAQYIISRPSPIVLSVVTTTIANCNTHTVNQNFSAQVTGGVPPIQFNWSNGTVSGLDNQNMTTNQNGLVTLTATDAIGCSFSYSLNVQIPVLGNPSFTQNSIGLTSYGLYSILDPIQFQSSITGDYTSVLWDFGDGTFSNEINPVHTYLSPNDYYLVTQTVTYPFGCVYVRQLALKVEKGYLLIVPNAFTPDNNDLVNDKLRPVTKGLKNIQLDIYDTWGSLIYSENGDYIVGWDGKIKGITSENGNYYAKVRGETFYGTIINENQTIVLIK